MSLEQENLASAHRREESLGAKPAKTQSNQNQEPNKESYTVLAESKTYKLIEVLEGILKPTQVDPDSVWKMFIDKARNSLGARAGVVLISSKGATFERCLGLNFPATNNEAKYKAFIVGLRSVIPLWGRT